MVIASLKKSEVIQSKVMSYFYNAGELKIFPEDLKKIPAESFVEKFDLRAFIPEYSPPESWAGKRVAVYKQGGLGDQLIASPLLEYLKFLGAHPIPICIPHPDYIQIWLHSTTALPTVFPLSLDAFYREKGKPFFDIALLLEDVYLSNQRKDQPNSYDQIYAWVGLKDVPDSYKKPVYHFMAGETDQMQTWLDQLGREKGKSLKNGYFYLHLTANNVFRTFPTSTIACILEAANSVAEELDMNLLVGNHRPFTPEIQNLIKATPTAVNIAGMTPGVTSYATVINGARAVVCPDSSAMHFAAAFDTPCLSIFGPYNPKWMTQYYPKNVSIWNKDLCVNSPCYHHLTGEQADEFPYDLCPRGREQKSCEVFEVTTQQVKKSLLSAYDLGD